MLPEDEPEGISLLQLTQDLCELEAITLEALKLRSGMRLNLQSLLQNRPAIEAAFISVLGKRRVFVALPQTFLRESWLEVGGKCLVRGCNGAHDFSFEANVLDLRELPFVHAHLEYPDAVECHGR